MIYWNKDKEYIGVKRMNLAFILFALWGLVSTLKNGIWFSFIFMICIIIAFNLERWLHYKAYSKTIWG